MKFIDLFAGIGGFRYGFEKASKKFKCVWSNDWSRNAVKIYRKHYGKCDSRDITKVKSKEIPDHDLLCGGFPCQAFSISGQRKGFEDTRGTLFFEVARILRDKRPRHFLLENVWGLLSHKQGKTFQTILRVLSELGYSTEWCVLNSIHFGVPQPRKRVYLFGTIRDKQADVGKRKIKTKAILLSVAEGFRDTNYDWREIGRGSAKIIREDAGISVGVDKRITKDGKEVFIGKCGND